MTHLSNRMSVGAAHRHSAFRISGKLFRVMFHLSRDQVRQPLTLIRILASSGAIVRPLSCGEHKPRLAQFTTPFVTQTHIDNLTLRNSVCYYKHPQRLMILTRRARAQSIFLEISIRVRQSVYRRFLHKTTLWALFIFRNTEVPFFSFKIKSHP